MHLYTVNPSIIILAPLVGLGFTHDLDSEALFLPYQSFGKQLSTLVNLVDDLALRNTFGIGLATASLVLVILDFHPRTPFKYLFLLLGCCVSFIIQADWKT